MPATRRVTRATRPPGTAAASMIAPGRWATCFARRPLWSGWPDGRAVEPPSPPPPERPGGADESAPERFGRRVPRRSGIGRPEPDCSAPAFRDTLAEREHPRSLRDPRGPEGAPRIEQPPGLPAVLRRVDTVLAARPAVQRVGEAPVLGQGALVRCRPGGRAQTQSRSPGRRRCTCRGRGGRRRQSGRRTPVRRVAPGTGACLCARGTRGAPSPVEFSASQTVSPATVGEPLKSPLPTGPAPFHAPVALAVDVHTHELRRSRDIERLPCGASTRAWERSGAASVGCASRSEKSGPAETLAVRHT